MKAMILVRNRWLVVVSAAVAVIVVGAAVVVGYVGEPEPPVIVTKKGVPPFGSGDFNWELAALALAGLGTLALAVATGTLAASTWQDVRASRLIAEAAVEANDLARVEQERRPQLALSADDDKIHSRVELDNEVYVRLLVSNATGLRAAQGTRVLVDRCVLPDGELVTFGTPALGWTSAAARGHDEAVVVFAGASRVIDLGALIPEGSDEPGGLVAFVGGEPLPEPKREPWVLRLGLPLLDKRLPDRREYVREGTKIRLVVGSDEADARFYDVTVGWMKDAESAEAVFTSLAVRVDEVTPDSFSS